MWICGVASLLLLVVSALEWSLIDLLTPFLYALLELGVWGLFLASAAWALGALIFGARRGLREAVPLFLMAVVAVLVLAIPVTDLWLKANYHWYRADRERIARLVQEGKLAPGGGGLLALGSREPDVSMGGNEIIVEEHGGRRYVFFYTFRGILDNYSGFLYVPEGGSPTQFSDLGETRSTQLRKLDGNWYFAAHR